MPTSHYNPRGMWASEARAHWQKYRPKMYAELEKSGQLEERLKNAVERAKDQATAFLQSGMSPLEAQSEAKRQHLFLPGEEDELDEGFGPMRTPDPASLITVPGPNVSRRKKGRKL